MWRVLDKVGEQRKYLQKNIEEVDSKCSLRSNEHVGDGQDLQRFGPYILQGRRGRCNSLAMYVEATAEAKVRLFVKISQGRW
jgi:hypothetical protein